MGRRMNKSKDEKYVIGLDYGTDSLRALLVNAVTGDEICSTIEMYPRWNNGCYCNPDINQYRQHPLDYIEVTINSIRNIVNELYPFEKERIAAISVDSTGSTPILINNKGIPLSLTEEFKNDPDAMFILWKDHTAIKESQEINEIAQKMTPNYLKYVGGIYSAEWVWAKVLHIIRHNKKLASEAFSWIELCDWIPAILTNNIHPFILKRGRCAMGHKALWSMDWGGLPPEIFFNRLEPKLCEIRNTISNKTYTSDIAVGNLSTEWSEKLNLHTNVQVGIGAFDCHMGAVGGEITLNTLVRSIGTSTCDIMIEDPNKIGNKTIKGICGQVDGSVIPGYIGLEAGQSAFGDVYAWFKGILSWAFDEILCLESVSNNSKKIISNYQENILNYLSDAASNLPVLEDDIVSLDWFNGRRTPDANQSLTGAITKIGLGSTAPMLFKSLVEATAFGSKAILNRFIEEGIIIKEIKVLGGVSQKSPYIMQTLANVLNIPIKVLQSKQTCALGACMFASVVAGIHKDIFAAQKVLGQGIAEFYKPNLDRANIYSKLFNNYLDLGKYEENTQNQSLTNK